VNAAVAERPPLFRDASQPLGRTDAPGRPSDSSGGGGLTLEEHLECVWEGLHADGVAECPVCHGRMVVASGGGRCTSCATQLA
jgi:hypothetical protein